MGKKRPNGDGSYYRCEARNLWYYEGAIAGKRTKRSGKTQKGARARWDDAKGQAEATASAPTPPVRHTLEHPPLSGHLI